jgi:hypothetical protein
MRRFFGCALIAAAIFAGCAGTATNAPHELTAQSARHALDGTGVLEDGGFESDGFTYWNQCGSGGTASIQSTVVHSGSYAAEMGSPTSEPDGDAALCQAFTVPAGATITFWIWEGTNDTIKYAQQYAKILSSSGTVLTTLYSDAGNGQAWIQRSYSLSAYAGETVQIEFGVHGTTSKNYDMVQYVDDVSVSGTSSAAPSASPSPSPSAKASASPSAKPSASPSAGPSTKPSSVPTYGPSPVPSGDFEDTACLQTPAPTQPAAQTNVVSTFFTTIIPNAKTICISAWDLSSNVTSALETAAKNGASVTVITPYSENSDNSSDLAAIIAAGGHAKTEYTSSSGKGTSSKTTAYELAPFDIHAKFALIDGIAYLDGHNWFNTDVIMQDPVAGDYAAIQADLVTFATPAPSNTAAPNENFTTDKQVSLHTESNYIQSIIPSLAAGDEVDFITESFSNTSSSGDYNDDVYDGLCQIAKLSAHVTMHVMVEDYSSSQAAALQNLMILDPNAYVKTDSVGHEKITMYRTSVGGAPVNAWFGSSNATTTDLFDWGIDVPSSNTSLLGSLQAWFDNEFGTNTGSGANGSTSIPTPAPGATATACGSLHA